MVDATGATVDNEAELVAASAAVFVSASDQLFGRLRAGSHGRRQPTQLPDQLVEYRRGTAGTAVDHSYRRTQVT